MLSAIRRAKAVKSMKQQHVCHLIMILLVCLTRLRREIVCRRPLLLA